MEVIEKSNITGQVSRLEKTALMPMKSMYSISIAYFYCKYLICYDKEVKMARISEIKQGSNKCFRWNTSWLCS